MLKVQSFGRMLLYSHFLRMTVVLWDHIQGETFDRSKVNWRHHASVSTKLDHSTAKKIHEELICNELSCLGYSTAVRLAWCVTFEKQVWLWSRVGFISASTAHHGNKSSNTEAMIRRECTKWEHSRTCAPLSVKYFRVLMASLIRVSSSTFLSLLKGTFKSARTYKEIQ